MYCTFISCKTMQNMLTIFLVLCLRNRRLAGKFWSHFHKTRARPCENGTHKIIQTLSSQTILMYVVKIFSRNSSTSVVITKFRYISFIILFPWLEALISKTCCYNVGFKENQSKWKRKKLKVARKKNSPSIKERKKIGNCQLDK